MVDIQPLYTLRLQGRLIGPLTLEKIRQMYQRGHVGSDATIALNGQAFRRLDAFPEIVGVPPPIRSSGVLTSLAAPVQGTAGRGTEERAWASARVEAPVQGTAGRGTEERAWASARVEAPVQGTAGRGTEERAWASASLEAPKASEASLDGLEAAELFGVAKEGGEVLRYQWEEPPAQAVEGPMPLYAGNLVEVPFSRLLFSLSRKSLTGRLLLYDAQNQPLEILVRQGQPWMPSSGLDAHDLRQRLLRGGEIPPESLAIAAKKSLQTGVALSDCLLASGLLPPHQLFEILQAQYSESLRGLFSLFEGRYLFFEEEIDTQTNLPARVDLLRLIKEGIETHYPLSRLEWIFEPFYKRAVTYSPAPPVDIASLALATQEERIYRMIGRSDTLWSLLRQAQTVTRIGPKEITSFLFFLAQVEVILFDGYILGSSLQKDYRLLGGRA